VLDEISLYNGIAKSSCEVYVRQIDLYKEIDRICGFIRDYLSSAGCNGVVLGLSGGIDSSLSAALCVKALGADKVHGVLLPYKTSHPDSAGDATLLAQTFGIKTETIEISHMADPYFSLAGADIDALRKGNICARLRMIVLYDLSAKYRSLVVGTSNRTELLVGYFTQHGDGACAFEPIGHLYKTEVWEMARILGIPEKIIDKAPTADLWDGQTDESELGITYKELDEILYELTELDINPGNSDKLSFPISTYRHVEKLIRRSEFKRHLPPLIDGETC